MSRAIAAPVGLLQILFNLVGLAAFAVAAVWLAVQGRWPEIGTGVLATAGGAAALLVIGAASDTLVWAGEGAGARGGGPGGGMLRILGLLISLGLTGAWVWGLFTYMPAAPAAAGPWPHVLFLYAIAVVAAWIAAIGQMGMAASRPERVTFAAFNTLACHVCALAVGACVVSGYGGGTLWALSGALVVTAIIKLMLASPADAKA